MRKIIEGFDNEDEPPSWHQYDKRVTAVMPYIQADPSSTPVLYDVDRPQFQLLKDMARHKFSPVKFEEAVRDYGLTTSGGDYGGGSLAELERLGLVMNGFETEGPGVPKMVWPRDKFLTITPRGREFVEKVGIREGKRRVSEDETEKERQAEKRLDQ